MEENILKIHLWIRKSNNKLTKIWLKKLFLANFLWTQNSYRFEAGLHHEPKSTRLDQSSCIQCKFSLFRLDPFFQPRPHFWPKKGKVPGLLFTLDNPYTWIVLAPNSPSHDYSGRPGIYSLCSLKLHECPWCWVVFFLS